MVGRRPAGGVLWLCVCACGTETTLVANAITSGNTQSCGCLGRESRKANAARMTADAFSGAPEYVIWSAMKDRCFNQKHKNFDRYGARGIVVCSEWRNDFPAFLAYVGSRPTPAHTIDRFPNNDGNYEPGNVRWATRAKQAATRSTAIRITIDGQTKCVAEWARERGIKSATVICRLNRGWSHERALSVPTIATASRTRMADGTFDRENAA